MTLRAAIEPVPEMFTLADRYAAAWLIWSPRAVSRLLAVSAAWACTRRPAAAPRVPDPDKLAVPGTCLLAPARSEPEPPREEAPAAIRAPVAAMAPCPLSDAA